MIVLLLLLSGLALFAAAVVARRHRRVSAEIDLSRPVSALVGGDQDLLPESGKDDGENGLAAFYAYQMAVGKMHRR